MDFGKLWLKPKFDSELEFNLLGKTFLQERYFL